MDMRSIHFRIIDSTNTWSKENYRNFERDKITLVTADQQTDGHGRYHRCWISPANQNIYATFTLFIENGAHLIGNISQVTSLAIVNTLKEKNLKPALKWPNDILVNRKKISGILSEVIFEGNWTILIVGIGLNVNMPAEMLEMIDQPATSLLNEKGQTFEINEILLSLKTHFGQCMSLYLERGFQPFLESYRSLIMHKKDEPLMINHQKGFFQSITDDGALVYTSENGETVTTFAGETRV